MKQVIQNRRTGQLAVKDVPEPQVAPGHALVRTRASLISAGTERMVTEFAKKTLISKARARPDLVKKVIQKAQRSGLKTTFQSVIVRLDEPLPLGYSAMGEVTALGAGLEGSYRIGQRVAMAGAGIANHAELNSVPYNLLAAVPNDVNDEEASFATVGAIALHAVRNLNSTLGDLVAVIGCGLVGQLICQFLTLSGVRVIALDYNQTRLDLAQNLGAEIVQNLSDEGLVPGVREITCGRGCDGIIIAAATESNEPFLTAAELARDRAKVIMVGLTGTAFPYTEFMKKELNIIVSRSYGPGRYDTDFENRGIKYPEGWIRWTERENLAETLRLMAHAGAPKLNVEALISHRFSIENAESAYEIVMENVTPHLGVILNYPHDTNRILRKHFIHRASEKDRFVFGAIGAGNFAKTVLLPILKNMRHVQFHTLVTQRGASSENTRKSFGFDVADTDPNVIFDDPAINAVLVMTRHDSHADLTARALGAGKNVFCEKPLALNWVGLNKVIAARAVTKTAFFQIGFNRRFAPAAIRLRDGLAGQPGPKTIQMRINAGKVEADHWIHAPEEGGGRLLGEACHFVDLARFLIGSPIVSVNADSVQTTHGVSDDATIGLCFADGSIANIFYTARGHSSVSKERIEAHAGGASYSLDDFRNLEINGDKRTAPWRGSQNKGFKGAMTAFVSAVANGGPAPIEESELIETSAATIAILDSLRTGERITL